MKILTCIWENIFNPNTILLFLLCKGTLLCIKISKIMQTEKVVNHIVDWLKEYANNARVNGFVIGISGGIDSAVTSTLCAKTGLDLLCIEMPIHQAASHVTRAQEHIAQLKKRFPKVKDTRVDLTPVFEEFKTEVSLEGEQATVDMALANTRARLRMTTLYYHAGLSWFLHQIW
jgi:NAD+ synthase